MQTAEETLCNSEGWHWWFIGNVSVHCPFSALNLILSLYRKIDKVWNIKWALFLHRLRNQWVWYHPTHLNIIYQKHDILGQVEVAKIEDNWIADHSLSKEFDKSEGERNDPLRYLQLYGWLVDLDLYFTSESLWNITFILHWQTYEHPSNCLCISVRSCIQFSIKYRG